MSSLGTNIRNLRVASGMSQSQLAEKIGKTRAAVSQYESGASIPRMGVIESLSSIFNVPKSEIIGDTAEVANYPSDEDALSADERLLVAVYRKMSPDGKDRMRELAAFLAERHSR